MVSTSPSTRLDHGSSDLPISSWDDVVLPEPIKDEVRRNMTRFLCAHQQGSQPKLPSSCSPFLSGPPGTGKTLVRRALTSELEGITFLRVTPPGFDRFGHPGYFFRWARERTPAIVFLEDLDLVAEIRGMTSTLGLVEMRAEMDGFKSNAGLVIIVTTRANFASRTREVDRDRRSITLRVKHYSTKAKVSAIRREPTTDEVTTSK